MSIRPRSVIGTTLFYTVLVIVSFFVALPIIWMVLMTIRTNAEIFKVPPRILPEKFTFESYRLFFSRIVLTYLFNSYFIGIATTLVSLAIAVFAAYGFSRFKFRTKSLMSMFVVATQTIPPIALLIPYYIFIIRLRLYDTYFGLIITYASFCLPYCIIMLTGYFNTISTELDDAVKIDGGSRLRTLWNVIVPVSVPGITATAVYCFLLTWNEFLFALSLVQSTNRRTIPVGITLFSGQNYVDWVMQMTIAFVSSVPVLVMYVALQRNFVAGLSAGAVKG